MFLFDWLDLFWSFLRTELDSSRGRKIAEDGDIRTVPIGG